MADSVFSKTLTYICEHNEQGALGIVINRPTDLTLINLFKQLDIPPADSFTDSVPVLFGGPVQLDCGFVLHQPVGKWQSTLTVNGEVGLTTSLDILKAIANAEGPAPTRPRHRPRSPGPGARDLENQRLAAREATRPT